MIGNHRCRAAAQFGWGSAPSKRTRKASHTHRLAAAASTAMVAGSNAPRTHRGGRFAGRCSGKGGSDVATAGFMASSRSGGSPHELVDPCQVHEQEERDGLWSVLEQAPVVDARQSDLRGPDAFE